MNRKAYLTNFARESGKVNLYAGAMGVIASINDSRFYTDAEKVRETHQTLSALTAVHADDSIPWDIEMTPAPTEVEEITLTDSITEHVWTVEEIMRREG